MIGITVSLRGEGAFADWKDRVQHNLDNDAPPIRIAGLEKGMKSGLPSVMIGIELPDGSVVMAQTSLRLLLQATDNLKAIYGDPRIGEFGGGKITTIIE